MNNQAPFKIFIVDDDIFCANLYEQHLKNNHYKDVSCFTEGSECIDNLNQNPDIIFLDYNLVDQSGFDVLKKIKRHNPNIYVVMVSGQSDVKTVVGTLKYGAYDYIVKDLNVCENLTQIIIRIKKAIDDSKKSNSNFLQRLLFLA